MQTGWLQQGNVWYWFNASGAMATGRVVISGVAHNFQSNGVWIGQA